MSSPRPDQLPDPPGVAEEARPEFAVRVEDGPRFRPEADRRYPGRFGEADQVGRNGHDHVVAAAHQLAADGEVGLDIAATSPAGQYEFHRGSWPLTSRASWRDAVLSARNSSRYRGGFRLSKRLRSAARSA